MTCRFELRQKQFLTAALTHQREVPRYAGVNAQGQRHDRECHGSASFRGRSTDHRPEDHRDGHLVAVLEQRKVVVFDRQRPPEAEHCLID